MLTVVLVELTCSIDRVRRVSVATWWSLVVIYRSCRGLVVSQSGETTLYIYETNRTLGSLHPALWCISTKLSRLLIASQFIPVVVTFGDKPRLSQVIKISDGIAADRP